VRLYHELLEFCIKVVIGSGAELLQITFFLGRQLVWHLKIFGQKMVEDHTRVGDELKNLAKSKNLEVPNQLPAEKERDLEQLRSTSDDNFDAKFKELMVKSHTEAVDLFSKASGDAGVSDRELKAFAAEKLPALQMHLKMAKELQTKKTQ